MGEATARLASAGHCERQLPCPTKGRTLGGDVAVGVCAVVHCEGHLSHVDTIVLCQQSSATPLVISFNVATSFISMGYQSDLRVNCSQVMIVPAADGCTVRSDQR